MAATHAYPGVAIQELPSPAQAVFSFAGFERLYGGLATDSELS
jgi:hypothetical protein